MLIDDIADIKRIPPNHPNRKNAVAFVIGLHRQRKRCESNFQAWERKVRITRIALAIYPDDVEKRDSLAAGLSIFVYFNPGQLDGLELQLTGKRL